MVSLEEQIQHPPYHQRYCAFIDILGFRELVQSLATKPERVEVLKTILGKVHNPEKDTDISFYTEFRAQSISDAVTISTVVNSRSLVQLINAITILTLDLLADGLLVRGALVKGLLYHDETTVYGEALIRAYELESTVVRYPRVMVTYDVVTDLARYCGEQGLNELFLKYVRQADDGPWFINVLRYLQESREPGAFPDRLHRRFYYAGSMLRSQIQFLFDQASDNPKHFEKVQWFARYWNDIMPAVGESRVTGAGLDPRPAVWGD
jgi:hypothetical protein